MAIHANKDQTLDDRKSEVVHQLSKGASLNILKLLLSLAIGFFSLNLKAQDIQYETSIEIIPCDESICLKILTLNRSDRPMYFQPGERLVLIKDSKGRKIELRGPIVEFPIVEFSDYKKIERNEAYEEIIDLVRSYALFEQGTYTVTVAHSYFDIKRKKTYRNPDSVGIFFFKGIK